MGDLEHNLFENLPNEVLQLIFAAIGDCKSLVRCMVVSRTFHSYASKITTLKIVLPKLFLTYERKLWNIYVMVKAFRALESLIVYVGQPKNEPSMSWARCMRYAEVGVTVEKFVFMAAKTGDFVEFDHALGLQPQFSSYTINNNHERAFNTKNKFEDITSKTKFEIDLLVKNQIASSSNKEDHNNDPSSTSSKNNVEYEGKPSTEKSDVHNHQNDEKNMFNNIFNFQRQPYFTQKKSNTPVIDFQLKQVIAPNNDVLKRMVPVIVFAIVQGLDEFQDTIPNFIENFIKLKRFVFVDILESLTIHMREHQIQQVRIQKLEKLNRLINENIAFKNNVKNESKSRKGFIDGDDNVNNDNYNKNSCHLSKMQFSMSTQALNKVEDLNNSPLKFQTHENASKNLNSNFRYEPRILENGFKNLPAFDEIQTPQVYNQIIKSSTSKNVYNVCQGFKNQRKNEVSWNDFSNRASSSTPSFKTLKLNTIDCYLKPFLYVNQLIEDWSYNDLGLKIWLKEKQPLASFKDTLEIGMKHIEKNSKNYKKTIDHMKIRFFEEMMSSKFQGSLNVWLKNMITTSKEHKMMISNQVLLNFYVLFSKYFFCNLINSNLYKMTFEHLKKFMSDFKNFLRINYQNNYYDVSHIGRMVEENKSLHVWKESSQHHQKKSESSSVSLNNSLNEKASLGYEMNKNLMCPTEEEKQNVFQVRRIQCSEDSSTNNNLFLLNHKSNKKKYMAVKEKHSKFIEKRSFKRELQKENFRRRERDCASPIANSQRYGSNFQLRNELGIENDLEIERPGKKNLYPQDCEESPKDLLHFGENSNSCEIKSTNSVNYKSFEYGQESNVDIKGKKIEVEGFDKSHSTSTYEMYLEEEENNSCVNKKKFKNHDNHINSFEKTVPTHNKKFTHMEDEPMVRHSHSTSSQNSNTQHNVVLWSNTRVREPIGARRSGRRASSARRDGQGAAAQRQQREARRERACESIQRRQRDIEQEALFFDISFWRSDQVAVPNYALSDVSMCIATHGARPLSLDDLHMLSEAALAGPLLTATIACVNEQIGSHNL
ncbi:uncharacterized protein [Physcomitrium patens]|uniref:uncharacterized protein isoform X3 n=1 Tax=Physcomitrium patens TaxID=3218 RepID=UPI000D17B3A2|nr:uncharacterized protein LOC112273484 isoform X2 [Physcomitrium patens]|eukprot:XP_024358131.1 uncharacterized protein LOC112273484 isoform X2 [Physcomitrella patens]